MDLKFSSKKRLIALCLKIFLGFLVISALSLRQAVAFESFFDTEVTIELCPEYPYGGIAVDVFYSVGVDPTLIPAEIISSSFDTEKNLYLPIIRLPSYYGVLPFNIVSFCRSFRGFSHVSNSISFSNCDKLALYDTDFDGISNNQEDTNCDNFFSPGDLSNPDNIDSDGDGVSDLVERLAGTSATNPGESPRPFIVSAADFDPDADGISNPVVWRPENGNWYIRNPNGIHTVFNLGKKGDIPFSYKDYNQKSDVGVIRQEDNKLTWYFRGAGFPDKHGQNANAIQFGIFGDNILLGAWEKPGITNPAVARLVSGKWEFYILQSDRTIKNVQWGGNGDLPKPQDIDGDGILDLAVYRPENQTTYVRQSSDNQIRTLVFGSGTADYTVKGDMTGDGKEELTFWEPRTALFTTLKSDNGINPNQGLTKNPVYYNELQLGEYYYDLPLNWNHDGDRHLYTVINHFLGVRKFYPNNSKSQPIKSIQWGLYGDFQG